MGQAGIEASYDRYLRGTDGTGAGHRRTRTAGRRAGRRTTVLPQPGDTLRLTIDIEAAAGRRERARATASSSRTRPPTAPTPTAARSSRSTRRPARCSRWPRIPTYKPSVFVSRDRPRSSPRCSIRRPRRRRTTPALNRAIDVGYPPGSTFKPVTALAAMEEGILTPDRADPLHAELHLLPAGLHQLGSRLPTSAMDLPDGARSSRATPTSTASGRASTSCPRACGRRCRTGRRRFGFGQPTPAIDIGPEYAGSAADARLALPRLRRAAEQPSTVADTSTASGSPATRFSWRSARATCW